jgi:hypothetical protein
MVHLRRHAIEAAALAALLLATACSTVSTRIKDRAQTFQQLPPAEQALVREGKIRTDFNADAVYLAWGKPDYIKPGITQGKPSETWTYIGYRQETIQHFDVEPRPVGRHSFAPEPITTPVYENHPYIRRQARFENGKVVAWSEGQLP